MTRRKYLRIALSADDETTFTAARAQAEQDTGIAMTESMFALSVLRKAVRDMIKPQPQKETKQ